MAINLSELQDIDIGDLDTWPSWFRVFVVLLVFGGILYAGWHFQVSHQVADLDRLQREETNLRNVYLDRKGKAINLPVYREQLEQIEENFSDMVEQLPDETEVPQLLVDITQAGLARGLEFAQFKPGREERGDFYSTLPVDLSVRGSYHQFGNFVSDLAGLSRIVNIGNFSMSGSPQGRLSVSAVVRTYRYLGDDFQPRTQGGKTTRVRASS